MPAGYLKMVREFVSKGMSLKAAKRKAARIWNSKHPSNPVHPGRKEQSKGKGKGREKKT